MFCPAPKNYPLPLRVSPKTYLAQKLFLMSRGCILHDNMSGNIILLQHALLSHLNKKMIDLIRKIHTRCYDNILHNFSKISETINLLKS